MTTNTNRPGEGPEAARGAYLQPEGVSTDSTQVSALDWALWCASLGGPVHPLKPGTKTPATTHGFRDATTDRTAIERWAAEFPGCNWGMANGHVFDVIDLDGPEGFASAQGFFEGTLPNVNGWVATAGGGLHGYIPATGRKRRTGVLPKVDLLGMGGYVVLPGSVLADGRAYVAHGAITRGPLDTTPWLRLWDHGAPAESPATTPTAGAPNDPARVQAYTSATLEALRRELAAAAEWDEGETDAHGRGWEKLIADAAHTVGRLARTDGTGITPESGLAVLLDLVPEDMAVDVSPVEKWKTQKDRGEPFTLPVQGPELFGLKAPVAGTLVDRRRVQGAMHAQAQFADGLAAASSGRHMFVPGMGWHYYDGKRWREDTDNARVLRALRGLLERTAAANIDNSDVLKAVRATSSATQMEGVLRIARASSELVRDVDALDANAQVLNVANGTLDLRTLELHPHDPADGITKVTRASWVPGTDWRATRWASFLAEVLPDEDVRGYLQRYVGLALLGEVREHKLVVLTGTGRNGKGVFYGAVSWALGDYAVSAEPDLFMHREGAHPTGQMDLRGARWVIVSETESGRRLADATVKRLTGGDAIRARRMGKDFVQFEPSHTAAMVTNHLPRVSAEDAALWARLRVVPFHVVVPDDRQDAALPAKLKHEADAVLSWAVEGLRDYYARGMAEPDAVSVATNTYRDDNDDLAEFLDERTEHTAGPGATVTELHDAWTVWCQSRRLDAEGRKAFAETLRRRGFETIHTRKGATWRGLAMKRPQWQTPLSGATGEVCEVSPAPPDISSYAEGPNETSQTSHTTQSTPLATTPTTPPPPGLTPAQRALYARLTEGR